MVHLLRLRLVSRYPYFFSYLMIAWTSTIAKWIAYHHASSYYPWVFWLGESFTVFAGFLLVWEIFRHTFLAFPGLRHQASVAALALVLVVLATNILLVVSGAIHWDHPLLRVERWLRLLQAGCLAAIIATARHYLLPLGRNLAGLALGFGLFVSLAVVSFVSSALANVELAQFSDVYAGAYLVALAIWSHSLWVFAPNPVPLRRAELDRDYFQVASALLQVRARLRKAIGVW